MPLTIESPRSLSTGFTAPLHLYPTECAPKLYALRHTSKPSNFVAIQIGMIRKPQRTQGAQRRVFWEYFSELYQVIDEKLVTMQVGEEIEYVRLAEVSFTSQGLFNQP